ncbi:hypothetical protein [Bradyrhizobium sp. AUGA SZCCT0431]|uniref:hypothetical protein n=1 Tax=Bradyrhizobium sp. AUGA SZCCT0431 TaxID=2807674 RepID=UPI001BAE2203|nr:hypothetical protein [Bradyrhizobium sp. AUGA SZCCT0431]MBR1147116.1 hypothetical protein [Bradyrhizobium sp. AUGA SZCCT0431]
MSVENQSASLSMAAGFLAGNPAASSVAPSANPFLWLYRVCRFIGEALFPVN